MTRVSTLIDVELPNRSIDRSSSTRSSLTWTCIGRSPISSRKIVEWLASSKRPICRARAPVNAPFSRPNSSLSTSVSGMAAQFTRTMARVCRLLRSWIRDANSSLPVPVSPTSSTVESVADT